MVTLRPYQKTAVERVLKEWDAGRHRTLLVLPTGTGKTIVFAHVIAALVNQGKRVCVLAHRGELLDQAAKKIKNAVGLECDVEKAEKRGYNGEYGVVVASVQTLMQESRHTRFPKDYFGAIIIDEAHHAPAESYRRITDYFDSLLLGVTATPDRGDKKALSSCFDSIAFEYRIQEAIKDEYLCRIVAQTIPLKIDIRGVRVSNGDYSLEDLGNAITPYLEAIAQEIKIICANRKTVIFLPLIRTSERMTNILRSMGINAVEVNGNSRDRTEKLSSFAKNEYSVLCNAMLLTEGWDCPDVDCIIVLRNTRIRSAYQQMIGRGTRIYPGKKNLLVPDFLWLTDRHDLCKVASLTSESEEAEKRASKIIEQSNGAIDVEDALIKAEQELFHERETAMIRALNEMRKRKRKLVDPLQFAFSTQLETYVTYSPLFEWEEKPPTKEQMTALEKAGIYTGDLKCSGQANVLLQAINDRRSKSMATPKQVKLLERYKFREVGLWSFEKAQNMIALLAKNNWVIPSYITPYKHGPTGERK